MKPVAKSFTDLCADMEAGTVHLSSSLRVLLGLLKLPTGRQEDLVERVLYPILEASGVFSVRYRTDTLGTEEGLTLSKHERHHICRVPGPGCPSIASALARSLELLEEEASPNRHIKMYADSETFVVHVDRVTSTRKERNNIEINGALRLPRADTSSYEIFDLVAYIDHIGDSSSRGHYVTYYRLPDGTWVYADDERVGYCRKDPRAASESYVMCCVYSSRNKINRSESVRAGLPNIGGTTCFFNAAVQALAAA